MAAIFFILGRVVIVRIQSAPFDDPIMRCVTTIQRQLAQAEDALIAEKDNDQIPESIVAYRRVAREGIIKYAHKWRPVMIEHIAGLQRRAPDTEQ